MTALRLDASGPCWSPAQSPEMPIPQRVAGAGNGGRGGYTRLPTVLLLCVLAWQGAGVLLLGFVKASGASQGEHVLSCASETGPRGRCPPSSSLSLPALQVYILTKSGPSPPSTSRKSSSQTEHSPRPPHPPATAPVPGLARERGRTVGVLRPGHLSTVPSGCSPFWDFPPPVARCLVVWLDHVCVHRPPLGSGRLHLWAVVDAAAGSVGTPVCLPHLLLAPGVKAETPPPGSPTVTPAAAPSPRRPRAPPHAPSSSPARAMLQFPASRPPVGWGLAVPVCFCRPGGSFQCLRSQAREFPEATRQGRAAGLWGVCLGGHRGPVTTQTVSILWKGVGLGVGLSLCLGLGPGHCRGRARAASAAPSCPRGDTGKRHPRVGSASTAEPIGASAPRFRWALSHGHLPLARTAALGSRQAAGNIPHEPCGRGAGVPAPQPRACFLPDAAKASAGSRVFPRGGRRASAPRSAWVTRRHVSRVPSVACTPALAVTLLPPCPWHVHCARPFLSVSVHLLPLRRLPACPPVRLLPFSTAVRLLTGS